MRLRILLKLAATACDLEVAKGCLTETESGGGAFSSGGECGEVRVEKRECERTEDAIVDGVFDEMFVKKAK